MREIGLLGSTDIASILATEVHEGVYGAGAMLPSERDLCERFGVGRTTIREAVKQLEAMRLVDLRKGHRPRVVYPTLTQLLSSISDASRLFFRGTEGGAHMEQARLFLETSLVRYAAESATPAQIGRMVAAIERADRAIDDLPRFRDADVEFHRALAEVPGNPIFIALHDAFVGGLMRARPNPRNVTAHNRRSNDEHKGVVQALMARDAEAAVAILTTHLARNYSIYVNQVLTPPDPAAPHADTKLQAVDN
ncbi:FCD domain-containing protein [Devosia sp.]|uniref:FCD domain-containing protein n=1 Tax=Devosia sp. TaxID=1871048 RepID=UPI003A90609D